jgi:prepilin-type N-terminal cleavage/methylation domain-containing protein/prepilin-type processing-associated H-X9-DG protein
VARLRHTVTGQGFTLIELLVVIAIIGILAAMLFPVFARARESARKIQCLSNVKNIAMAVQMYLTDYDRFPPNNKDRELLDLLNSNAPSGRSCTPYGYHRLNGANPYIHWPVILDEYIKNRDVWVCPSTRHVSSAGWIVPQYTAVYWWYLRDTVGLWGRNDPACAGGPCCEAWPPGWGGAVTDSIGQQLSAYDDPGSFRFSIATSASQSYNRSTSEIDDPTTWVVVGDNQSSTPTLQLMFSAAYATNCCWELSDEDCVKFYDADPSFRKQYAPHLGGLNLGFADGHAKWWNAEAAVAEAGTCCTRGRGSEAGCAECVAHTGLGGMCPDFEVHDNVP